MEDMAFDDLILESVQSVTKAATSLINAATVAQKVLVAQGKMSKNAKKVHNQDSYTNIHKLQGKEDSQWSQGLVSAAQVVASVIGSLCEAANTVIQVRGKSQNKTKKTFFLCPSLSKRREQTAMCLQRLQSKSQSRQSSSSWLAR